MKAKKSCKINLRKQLTNEHWHINGTAQNKI